MRLQAPQFYENQEEHSVLVSAPQYICDRGEHQRVTRRDMEMQAHEEVLGSVSTKTSSKWLVLIKQCEPTGTCKHI